LSLRSHGNAQVRLLQPLGTWPPPILSETMSLRVRSIMTRTLTRTGLINHLHRLAECMSPALLAGLTVGKVSSLAFMSRVVLATLWQISLFHICIPQELGSPFFVFLACDLSGGISPLQELQGRLHLPIGDSSHRHHKGKEDDPKKNPEKPPNPMHSPKIVVHRLSTNECGLSLRARSQ